jgi:Ca-activated chloride channel family protein
MTIRRTGLRISMLAFALLLAAGPAAGAGDDPFAGTLFWRGPDGVSRPAVALDTQVEIRVSGLVARAVVRQRFANRSALWLEGVYVFPLPEMAAVDRMTLQVGEQRIEGHIAERAAAKRSYEGARRSGRTASLLEQERPNLFTTSVANIGPDEEVAIEIEYQQLLRYEQNGFELRFPMTLTSRYVPGLPASEDAAPPGLAVAAAGTTSEAGTGWAPATDAVPDAARITPPMLHPDDPTTNPLHLRLLLDAGFPLARIDSPSHDVRLRELGGDRFEVSLEDVPADRDFVLRWAPERGAEPRAALFSEAFLGERYVLLMLLPPQPTRAARRMPREAVLVIDTSGSMGGTSITQARAALHLALERLAPEDTFNVIAFDDRPRSLFDQSVPVSAGSLRRAHAFVDGLVASGGTEMKAALERALHEDENLLRGEPRLRQVVFITDASIGNEAQLFAAIQRDLGRSRLFMVGIGSAPNAYFLNRAATLGRGTATVIGSPGELRERMDELTAKIESPMLGDLELHWNDEVEMWPARVPDLYAGEPVVVTARVPRFVGDVVITGRRSQGADDGDDRAFEMRLPLTPGTAERGIHKLWGRRKIAHWMMQRGTGLDPKLIREQVLDVALEHQLVSAFTSLVAVEVTPRRPASAPGAGTNVPNASPAGSDPTLVAGVLPQGATPAALLLRGGALALGVAALLAWAERRRGRLAGARG